MQQHSGRVSSPGGSSRLSVSSAGGGAGTSRTTTSASPSTPTSYAAGGRAASSPSTSTYNSPSSYAGQGTGYPPSTTTTTSASYRPAGTYTGTAATSYAATGTANTSYSNTTTSKGAYGATTGTTGAYAASPNTYQTTARPSAYGTTGTTATSYSSTYSSPQQQAGYYNTGGSPGMTRSDSIDSMASTGAWVLEAIDYDGVSAGFLGGPPPGGEAPSNVDLVMSVRQGIHPKPYKKRLLADRALRPFSAAPAALVRGLGLGCYRPSTMMGFSLWCV